MNIDDLLGINPNDETARHARQLVEADRRLIAELVERRRDLGLSQREVARRMDSDQSTVARIESGGRDLHQSTIRRYAMAVDAVVEHKVSVASKRRTGTAAFAAAVAGEVARRSDEQWPADSGTYEVAVGRRLRAARRA